MPDERDADTPEPDAGPDVVADLADGAGGADGADGAGGADRPPARRTRRRVVGWTTAVVVAGVLVAGALLALDALRARDALAEAIPLMQGVEQTLAEDPAAEIDLAPVQELTTTARASTDGPLWWLAARVPGVGADARAVSVSAAAVDAVTHEVLPPLLEARDGIDLAALRPVDGRIDLAPFEAAAPLVIGASDALTRATADVDALDTDDLRPLTADPVTSLRDGLATLDERLTTARTLTTVLPPLLGADGERRYLVLFLTNAELRSTGGIPGSLAVLTADDGAIELADQVATTSLPPFPDPVPGLSPDDQEIYSTQPALFIQDTTMLPDFPSAAALAATMWEEAGNGAVDGVIAADPVALSYLLDATGPLDAPGGQIDAGNAVDLLLSDAYARYPEPDDQDAFFSAVSATVFGAALNGTADPRALAGAVERAADERRLNVWSADAGLELELERLHVAGSLAAEPDAAGVFLNDGTGAKLGFYLDAETTADVTCDADGSTTTITTTLTSTVPADPSSLPWYVLGTAANAALEPGVIRTNVAVYSPSGGTVGAVTQDGAAIGGRVHDHAGRQVTMITVELAPGASTTLTATVTATGDGDVALRVTPTARQGGSPEVPICG